MGISLLVSPQWLQDNLANPEVGVIENPWVADAYQRAHIRGGIRVPGHPYLKKIDTQGQRTQQVMDADDFAVLCHNLGLRRNKHYVVYDDFYGLFAARFWWVCRHFGVRNISILDGSWRGWLAQGRPVSSRIETPESGSDVVIGPEGSNLIALDELRACLDDPEIQIWDTRRKGEYTGDEDSENLRRGHVPGSLNLVWTDLLTEPVEEGGARFLKPVEDIRQLLSHLGLYPEKTVITYCQSGIRAAFCLFVLELLGFCSGRLYDASMAEWANLKHTPLVTGSDAA